MTPGLSDLEKVRSLTNELAELALVGDWERLSERSEQASVLCPVIFAIDWSQLPPREKATAKLLIEEILRAQATISKQLAPWLTDVRQLLDALGHSSAHAEKEE